MAASGRDGTHTLYSVVFGHGAAPEGASAGALEALRQERADEEAPETVRRLAAALDNLPSEVAACERLLELQRAQTAVLLAQARQFRDCDDCGGAMAALDLLRAIAPEEPELYLLLKEVRERRLQRDVMAADDQLQAGEFAAAGTTLRGILDYAPHSLEARRRLAGLETRRAELADAEADRLIAAAQVEEGLAALERAQHIAASAERAEKIRRAQIALEYAEGMRAYGEKRYREAIFQFKKVLARDAAHADALRHLNFAQRFEQDSNEALNDRFGRIE